MDDQEFEKLQNEIEQEGKEPTDLLNAYAKAFREEFDKSQNEDPDNLEVYVQDFFKKNLSASMAQMVWLSNNAASETVRFQASKFVIEEARKESESKGDPIKSLLNELSKKG